jgi:hypothetical protein
VSISMFKTHVSIFIQIFSSLAGGTRVWTLEVIALGPYKKPEF